jgi:hypothetical protein
MKFPSSASRPVTQVLNIMVVASLLSGTVSSRATAAPPEPAIAEATSSPAAERESTEVENWRKKILRTPRPSSGCFTAIFPETAWREVPCKTPPHKAYPPKRRGGIRPGMVGGSSCGLGLGPCDFSAEVNGRISEAEGSFGSISGVTSECSVPCPDDACPLNPTCTSTLVNAYALQLNTNPFMTTTCSGSPSPSTCQGFEQFVYDSSGSGFIQYWLQNYGPGGTSCPTPRSAKCAEGIQSDGWCPYPIPGDSNLYCVINAEQSASPPPEPINSLQQLKVTGFMAGVTGSDDSITVWDGNTNQLYSAFGNNYFLDLGKYWQDAEFNVFGDGNGDQAVFNTGSTIVVRTNVYSGTRSAPACYGQSFTAETNNLNTGACCAFGGTSPEIAFIENSAGGATLTCDCTTAGSCSCLPLGSLCSNEPPGVWCCGTNECIEGVCTEFRPPPECNGRPRPPTPCAGQWHCCGRDGWVCGVCR